MDRLTVFGFIVVSVMVFCYSQEEKNTWFRFGFAASCVLTSLYGALQHAYPIAFVEFIWAIIAFKKWQSARSFSVTKSK